MYRHRKVYELRYTDVDAYDVIKPSSLLSFLEESACLSADELGFGYKDIAPLNKGFIIVNWYIDLYEPVKLGSKLEVHTWPIRPKHLIFLRDYEMFVEGKKVGAATARWCMIDTLNFNVLPANAYFKEEDFESYNTERSIDFKAWKIARAEGAAVYKRQIAYSDYDHYFHANNTKYADYLIDAFKVEEFKGKYIKNLQITYVKQCKIGEEIEFIRQDVDGGAIVEGSVDGELRVQFKVGFNEL